MQSLDELGKFAEAEPDVYEDFEPYGLNWYSYWSQHLGLHTAFEMPRAAVLRSMILNHGIHHRGQLEVYLRMNDVALPQIYGPTADEPDMAPAGQA